ncbi:dUTP diphosphatase [Pseudomonas sp. GX19020]|uniref:dUTP diphosphatase n=1 Tax=Pseudomonas sp. GX19020 TaxID=2942277 RepID=UPI00201898EB|nr:dUTP diphosphatase [Pseudomonas sp. GX19020]MCL4068186.1 dUTP diphosphatase [Pseudomonas sp. GX19020]
MREHPPQRSPEVEVRILDPRLNDWGLPRYQSAGAAAVDLMACIDAPVLIAPQAPAVLVKSGIALNFGDMSLAALVLPRSGLGHKKGLVMGNGTGLIDPDYTGEIMVSVWNRNPAGSDPIEITPGERIAQMIFVPVLRPDFRVVEAFSNETARGAGGFGSTGG